MAQSFIEQFTTARKRSIPLLAIQTPDPATTIAATARAILADPETKNAPLIKWDIVSGFTGLNSVGDVALTKALGPLDPKMVNIPVEALAASLAFPKQTAFYFCNAHRYFTDNNAGAQVSQGVYNLRDEYKRNERTLIMLCPSIELPSELAQHVVILDEPLPTPAELAEIAKSTYALPHGKPPAKDMLAKMVEATRGLAAFPAEQVISLALTREGCDIDTLWERKRKTIEQTRGLKVYRGKETFKDVMGVPVLKTYLTSLFNGKDAPTVLVFMDEIEKMFAGAAGGDTSGTAQAQHMALLTTMQDEGWLGILELGHPGCSKSFISKATAGEFQVPMAELNMEALKGSYIGQSGMQTRGALKTISALGRPLVLATSNNIGVISPELKRRFKQGIWFFDLPTREERHAVWKLYVKKLQLGNFAEELLPDDSGWTPAEIETCCVNAWRFGITLKAAAQYVVPVCQSSPDKIERLRKEANGCYLSVSHPGIYKYEQRSLVDETPIRKIRFDEVGQA
jgi:hypothetical protein